eukprot:5981329-Lingulodinium_polyedra.AAC.1
MGGTQRHRRRGRQAQAVQRQRVQGDPNGDANAGPRTSWTGCIAGHVARTIHAAPRSAPARQARHCRGHPLAQAAATP